MPLTVRKCSSKPDAAPPSSNSTRSKHWWKETKMTTRSPKSRWSSLPKDALGERQAARLRRYLRDVVLPFSPHYRDLFAAHRLDAGSIRTLADLERIPFTSKADLLPTVEAPDKPRRFILQPEKSVLARRPGTIIKAALRGREFVARQLEAEYRPLFLTSTTGRSAEPTAFVYTRHDLQNLETVGRRIYEICGAQREFRMLNMFPFAPHLAFWLAYHGGTAFGVFVVSSGGGKVMGTEGQLRFMRKINPDVLIGMPTFVYHVLQQAAEEGIRCEKLSRIVLGGEKVPPGMRRKLRQLAGALGAGQVHVLATYGFT
ncbi:MAG TPA: hypothetical protein DCY13_14385, partial [Verrucomicrobiales bacterium]|nr:hypothetical protein [Verrucomicrobiales bacterium]